MLRFLSYVPCGPCGERLCDLAVVAFALWTMSAHAVVALGGNLRALLLVFAAVLAVALLLRRALGGATPATPAADAEAESPPLPQSFLSVAVLGSAAATALIAERPNLLPLWWGAVILLGLAAVPICRHDATHIAAPDRSRTSELLLWLLAAAGVVLTLISHRPDSDDSFYANMAVGAADLPGVALLSADTMHGIAGLPLNLPMYQVHSFELLNGAVSYLTGIPALYAFHWLSAAVGALLMPLAYAQLLRILSPRRWLATVATLMVILIAAGEVHRWYGNFAFVRMWQGKAIFLSVFLPLIYAYALRFAASPNLRDWLMLGAAQIAAVGATSSALWAAPVAAMIGLCSAVRASRQGLKTLLIAALSFAYVLCAAWFVRARLTGSRGAPIFRGLYPNTQLYDVLTSTLGDSRLLIVAIIALLAGWAVAPPGLGRRFAVLAPLAALLGLLNPYIADWVAANVTGPSYWRSLWALPLPILMALAFTAPLTLGDGSSWPLARHAAWLTVLAAFAILVPRYGGLSPENGVRLAWPGLKVPDTLYRWAVAVNESVPRGSHVAVPSGIDEWIVTLHHHAYPLIVREYLRTWPNLVSPREVRDRVEMRHFLDAPELVDAAPERFRQDLDRFAVRAVCLTNSSRARSAKAILRQAGFRRDRRDAQYELWVLPNPLPSAAGAARADG